MGDVYPADCLASRSVVILFLKGDLPGRIIKLVKQNQSLSVDGQVILITLSQLQNVLSMPAVYRRWH